MGNMEKIQIWGLGKAVLVWRELTLTIKLANKKYHWEGNTPIEVKACLLINLNPIEIPQNIWISTDTIVTLNPKI